MTFITDSIKTKSDKFHSELLSKEYVVDMLQRCIDSLELADDIKKKLFYNKPNTVLDNMYIPEGKNWDLLYTQDEIDIIHAILGIATESGELLEALVKLIDKGEPLDYVNLKEESGDVFWYQAILGNAIDSTFEETQATVIEKLKARFPDKFTEHHANNRDLDAERKILEK